MNFLDYMGSEIIFMVDYNKLEVYEIQKQHLWSHSSVGQKPSFRVAH